MDFGFWEVDKTDAKNIEASRRLFLSEGHLIVTTASCFSEANDLFVVSGYPKVYRIHANSPVPKMSTGLITVATEISGSDDAPPSTILRHFQANQVLDLWIPKEGNLDMLGKVQGSVEVPRLQGVSGGGCWLANMSEDIDGWTPSLLRLAGIHVGSSNYELINGKDHSFSREVLIGHHLHLIAESDPTMRDYILNKWPSVEDFPID